MNEDDEQIQPETPAEWTAWTKVYFGPEQFEKGEHGRETARRIRALRQAGEVAAALYHRRVMEMDVADLESIPWAATFAAVKLEEPHPRDQTLPERAAHAIWARLFGQAEIGDEHLVPTYAALLARAEALTPHAQEALLAVQETWSGTLDELFEAARIMGESD